MRWCSRVSCRRRTAILTRLPRLSAQRYLRTARVQLTARMYGDIYHAADAMRDLRRQMLAGRTPEQAYNGVAWLYDGI